MKILYALTLSAVLLTACGETGPIAPPPATPNPSVPPPGESAPPVAPGQDVPYYGEWGWQFEDSSSYPFDTQGRFSVFGVLDDGVTSYGEYQDCTFGDCFDFAVGSVFFGPDEDGELSLVFYRLDTSDNVVTTYYAVDDDGVLSQDERGRDVFEGRADWLDTVGDPRSGTLRATLIDGTPVLR